MLQPHFETLNKYKRSALPSKLKLDRIPKHISTMSPPPPSEEPTLPDPLPGVQNTLFKLSRELNGEHLPVDRQQQSLLFDRLPPEIRNIIWQYALSGKIIEFKEHGILKSKRLAGYTLGYTFRGMIYKWRTVIQMDDGASRVSSRPNLRHGTALLKTCRLILREAMDDLCGCNRFILSQASFWKASTEIMPHHFAQLRIMDFSKSFDRDDREDWTQLCKTIAGMTKLRKLDMRLRNTSKTDDDDREKHRSGGLRRLHRQIFGSPKVSVPVSEEFILDSLCQIEQVKEFVVELDDRWGNDEMPKVHSNAPFKLICKFGEDRVARREKKEQEEHERKQMQYQKAAEEHRLRKAQRDTERLERKAQEMVESCQPFSG